MVLGDKSNLKRANQVARHTAHSLRNPGQTVAQAIGARERFIQNALGNAVAAPNRGEMLRHFGAAMHAVMDKYSPVHNEGGQPNAPREYAGPISASGQGHSPVDSWGDEGTNDITPEIQEQVSVEIQQHWNYVNKVRATLEEMPSTMGDFVVGGSCSAARIGCN
jgi:hypothetical protein